jgi:hypothetical protein
LNVRYPACSRRAADAPFPPNCAVHERRCYVRFALRDIQSLATNVHNPSRPTEALSIGTPVWYQDTAQWRARRSLKFMPKRGIEAGSRVFFDELSSLTSSRLKAMGAIRLEDRQGVIAFGDEDHGGERRKCIGVAHTILPGGGAWCYFICPRCGGRKKKLWLVDDAPRCLSCCWSLGVRYRSAYGFGRSERLLERDRYLDRVEARRLRAQTSAHDDDAPQHDRLPARSARSSTEGQGRI